MDVFYVAACNGKDVLDELNNGSAYCYKTLDLLLDEMSSNGDKHSNYTVYTLTISDIGKIVVKLESNLSA